MTTTDPSAFGDWHPLPSSADLAAHRRSLVTNNPEAQIGDWSNHPGHGAWAFERDCGIGSRSGDGMTFAGETRTYPLTRRESNLLRSRAFDRLPDTAHTEAGIETFVPFYRPQDAPGTERDDDMDASAPLVRCLPSVDLCAMEALAFAVMATELDQSGIAY